MGERKVLNRYFPPDFDPLLVPKQKYDPYKQVEVRMMIPFSLQCIKCGEYMYRGKKFNSRKEDVIGDDYLGIKKYRFYIKCCVCNNEIAFKTDPKNQDYVCESGSFGGVLCFFTSLALVAFFPSVAPSTLRPLVARPPARRRRRRGASRVAPQQSARHAARREPKPHRHRSSSGRRASTTAMLVKATPSPAPRA